MIRLHLCQFFYLPAYYDYSFDLLEEPAPILGMDVTLGHLRRLDCVTESLIDFKASYLTYITNKISNIVQWCIKRKTNIMIFPEYSIPVEILPLLHQFASENSLLIVAGTHRVRLSESTRDIYRSIKLNIDDRYNGSAISPIIFPDGKVIGTPKRSKSKWEPNLNIDMPQDVSVYPMTMNSEQIIIAVAPCIDSLLMETLTPFWSKESRKPNMLICPSMSPASDLFESIGKTLAANETLFAYCNSSAYGGTMFNIPDEWDKYLQGSPMRNRSIPAQNEAVLELDVDL